MLFGPMKQIGSALNCSMFISIALLLFCCVLIKLFVGKICLLVVVQVMPMKFFITITIFSPHNYLMC